MFNLRNMHQIDETNESKVNLFKIPESKDNPRGKEPW